MRQFERICAMLAAFNLFESGVSVAEIATEAGKSPRTIRRWIRTVRGF